MDGPRRATAGAALAAFVVGCSLIGGTPPDGTIAHPGGSNLVARVEWTGGFVPYETLFTSLPLFTLLGDGRVIVQGPQIEIYPGPALPNLQVRRLTEEGVQSVLFRFAETGLFDENHTWDAATTFVADANSTVFTLHANSRDVVVDVYALGLVSGPNVSPSGFPRDELDAHQALTSLQNDLLGLDSWIPADDWADPAWQSFQSDALRLLVANVDGLPPNPDGLDADPLPWPAVTAPDQFGTASDVHAFRCGVATASEATTWYAGLATATERTRWTHDGHVYAVTPRPLLPDEAPECAFPQG